MTKTIPELWIERQRLHADNQRNLNEEPEISDAEYREWERHTSEVFEKMRAVERLISDTPAASIDDVLIKVRIAGYRYELEYGSGRVPEDDGVDDMLPEERMTLMAYRDIKRLCNDPPDPRESREAAE